MKFYSCPNCKQYTSENFINENNKIVCQRLVNRSGKLVQCQFEFFINEYNERRSKNGKEGDNVVLP